jgi:multidrug efflux system outer membrane protein
MNRILPVILATTALTACSLAPTFTKPDVNLPHAFKEQPVEAESSAEAGNWKKAESLEKEDRGLWWKIFGDTQLNDLEKQAIDANQELKAAAARVDQARDLARVNTDSLLPDLDIGANALRSKPASAQLAAFGQPAVPLKPYNLYSAEGTLSYEVDLFGKVRDNYKAFSLDADAQAAAYNSALLALQADVAQNYFTIRSLDAERALMRDTIKLREEATRIMQHRFDVGDVGEQDLTRTKSELAGTQAELLELDRSRAKLEHALAVLLGKMPSDFTLAEAPLDALPPEIPAGLPSSLLERRPDISASLALMEAANARIGVARTAFFPSLILTATGGYESTKLSDLFRWPNRTWSLGQLAGNALTMPIFDSGRNLANLDEAHAAYDESVANYRQSVLVAFKDVEDNLVDQRLLAEQTKKANDAAWASQRTTDLTQKRYDGGDVDFFEVINAQRDSLAAGRAAVQTKGQRLIATVTLIRALGGGFDEEVVAAPQAATPPAAETPAVTPAPAATPAPVAPLPATTPEQSTPASVTPPATPADKQPEPEAKPLPLAPAAETPAPAELPQPLIPLGEKSAPDPATPEPAQQMPGEKPDSE